jgi:hypothetical protein
MGEQMTKQLSPIGSAIGNIVFNAISVLFLVALWYLYGKFAPLLAYGAIISQRYAIHCWLSRYGVGLR